MTRTLSLPCVGALVATHSSLPTELSRDQHCSPHRVQQSCLLASKRRKENLKPTHQPSATQRLSQGPRPKSPDRHSLSATLPGTALMLSAPHGRVLTDTHTSIGLGTRDRPTIQNTPALERESASTPTQNSNVSGAAADTQNT